MPLLARLELRARLCLSFGVAILGGTCTLIGTSTNLVVAGFQEQRYADNPFPKIRRETSAWCPIASQSGKSPLFKCWM